MSVAIRGNSDDRLEAVRQTLAKYESAHPRAKIEAYRQNSVSIRIRIVDPDFVSTEKADRHDSVWRFLEELPERVQSEISVLLLLTPGEQEGSFANLEFDNPMPSRL